MSREGFEPRVNLVINQEAVETLRYKVSAHPID